jgi:hypothetical protein
VPGSNSGTNRIGSRRLLRTVQASTDAGSVPAASTTFSRQTRTFRRRRTGLACLAATAGQIGSTRDASGGSSKHLLTRVPIPPPPEVAQRSSPESAFVR